MAWVNCAEYENTSKLKDDLKSVIMRMERIFDRDEEAAKWWTGEKDRARTEKVPWVDALEECS